jgi:hypothetical protein
MPAGRPTDYCQEIADAICERLANGESLRQICSWEDMPNRATVFRWLGLHKEFSDLYARAKEEAAELFAEEIVEIADEREGKAIMSDGQEVAVVFDSTAVARNRLRVDARKWVAAKLKPRKYGDRVAQEISGPDGGPVQITRVERVIVRPENPDR